MKICRETQNLIQIGHTYQALRCRPKYVLLLPATTKSLY